MSAKIRTPEKSYNEPPSYADERFAEMLFDEVKFERLLHLAEILCLAKSPQYETLSRATGEQAVIERLGTRGLRLALELLEGEVTYDAAIHESESTDTPRIYPIDRPEYFNGPLNRTLLAKAEAFGAQLLDEAYAVLGPDADEYAALFRNADTIDQQHQALSWLIGRLEALTDTKRGAVQDDDTDIYHPLRISPKMLGRYPRHTMATTCLGVAMLGASFLRKADARFLHGGVMESERQAEIGDAIHMITALTDSDSEFALPDSISERLAAKHTELFQAYTKDRGTHSALYVQLVNGDWVQIDTNFKANSMMPLVPQDDGTFGPVYDNKLTDIADTLESWRHIAPGLELSGQFWTVSPQSVLMEVLGSIVSAEERQVAVEALIDILPDESTITPLCEYVMDVVLGATYGDEGLNSWCNRNLLYDWEATDYAYTEPALQRDCYWAVENFVLWGMPVDEWRIRCQTDAQFRANRVEDIVNLPALLVFKYGLSVQGRDESRGVHSAVEFGLPEVRIGLSVLNNIALYCDNDLSVHHWLSQWPSQVAVTDRLDTAERSRAHAATLHNNAAILDTSRLRYAAGYGKITKFLDEQGH